MQSDLKDNDCAEGTAQDAFALQTCASVEGPGQNPTKASKDPACKCRRAWSRGPAPESVQSLKDPALEDLCQRICDPQDGPVRSNIASCACKCLQTEMPT